MRGWWRGLSRGRKILVVVGAFFALGIIGSLAGEDSPDTEATLSATEEAATTTQVATTATTEAFSCPEGYERVGRTENCVSIAPATTEAVAMTPEQNEAIYVASLAEMRLELADAIEEDFGPSDVETVDSIQFAEGDSSVLAIEATSAYSTEEIVQEVLWAVTRALAPVLYGQDGLGQWTEGWGGPALRLTLNSSTAECSAEFMGRMVERAAGLDDWESECLRS